MDERGLVERWLEERRQASDLVVRQVSLPDCEGWALEGGRLNHKMGRFFSVVGVRVETGPPYLVGTEQPMIDQPEIGILGFVVYETADGWSWLLQAKTEPGNVHGVQAAPSVQATWSNYMRVHGGLPTPLIECFVGSPPAGVRVVLDVEQSEQGDRFLGKYNRNAVAIVPSGYPVPDAPQWTWVAASEVRRALETDFAVNTDARSVLFCADWRLLTDRGGQPFARWRGTGGFGEALFDSLTTGARRESLGEVTAALEKARAAARLVLEPRPLSGLEGWRLDANGIVPSSSSARFQVGTFAVHASDREVKAWHQPLFVGEGVVSSTMMCARFDGVLRFLLRAAVELGFREGVQFAPTKIDDPLHSRIGWADAALADSAAVTQASVLQSDEGGRFMNSVARYSIVEVPCALTCQDDPAGLWVTLGQLREMAAQRAMLTNEARSILSLLLAWA